MQEATEPLILVINPGSTSTKVALFHGDEKIESREIRHDPWKGAELWDQFEPRAAAVETFLQSALPPGRDLQAVAGRGGLLKPLKRGTYRVNGSMIEDCRRNVQGAHVSNLGAALAGAIARRYGCPAYTVDPVSVDEFEPLAYYSGHPLIPRRSLSHALNLRAAALRAAGQLELDADRSAFVVVHMGGGISVAPVQGGRVIDVNDASSAGPFSPERSGSLPLMPVIDLCFSGQYSIDQIKRMIMGRGGMKAYLGTSDLAKVECRIESGDEKALVVLRAMAYQIAKETGAMATVLRGQVDAVVLTGGLAHSERLIQELKSRIAFIAPVLVYPGEMELEAMAGGVLRVLRGREQALTY